jgi:hypothetical protein
LNPAAICTGTTFTYSPTTYDTTTSYTWTRAAVAGISNAAVIIPQTSNPNEVLINTTTNPVSVVYQYILTDHGCMDTELVTVVVNPLPAIPVITVSGDTLTSSANYGNQWYRSNTLINGATNQTYIETQNGQYSVIVTDSNGCTATSAPTNITVGNNELSNKSYNGLTIYPNPASDNISIAFTANTEGNYVIRLIDMPGRIIREDAGKAVAGGNKHEFSLDKIAKGIYIVELGIGDDWRKVKLVVE